jgi:hypothetical protein
MKLFIIAMASLLAAAPAFADAPKKAACTAADTAKLESSARDHMMNGEDAASLVDYEKAYACQPLTRLLPLLVLESCKSGSAKKAQKYYDKCGKATCKNLVARCETFRITLK